MPSFRNALLLLTTSMLLAQGAQAQSNSCELLKQTLSARIPPEIKGYAMDDVPAKAPVPPGGKVIGTCEGGARKVVYRRFGGAPLAGDGAAAPATAPATAPAITPAAPASAVAPSAPKPAPAAAVVPKEAPKPNPKPEPVAPPKAVAPAKPVAPPVASAPLASPAKPAPTPVPVPAQAKPPVQAPAATPVASAPVALARPAAPEQPAQPPALPAPPAAGLGNEPHGDDTPGFLGTYGRWLWLLLALPFVAWLWGWVSHRMTYDKAGLPRGPRL